VHYLKIDSAALEWRPWGDEAAVGVYAAVEQLPGRAAARTDRVLWTGYGL